MPVCDEHTAMVREQGRQAGILDRLATDFAETRMKIDDIHERITSSAVQNAEFKGKVSGGVGLANWLVPVVIGVLTVIVAWVVH